MVQKPLGHYEGTKSFCVLCMPKYPWDEAYRWRPPIILPDPDTSKSIDCFRARSQNLKLNRVIWALWALANLSTV